MKSEITKERIIDMTIALIESQDGDIDKITIRKIAQKADVGIGLINHYFKTKDNLIEICIQKIIGRVVYMHESDLNTDPKNFKSNIERTKNTARYVMDFLFEHPEISYISILGDFKNPQKNDNSMGTVYGFASCMSSGKVTQIYLKKAFELVGLMQNAFLKKDLMKEISSINLDMKIERDNYINSLVDMIMGV